MRWRDIADAIIRCDAPGGVSAEIVQVRYRHPQPYVLTVWRAIDDEHPCSHCAHYTTLDDAKAAAVDAMRAAVIAARGEAENVICDASRWLRANGGEP